MSRILLVSNYGWTVYNFRRNLIRELQLAGHEVFVQTEFDGYERRLGLEMGHIFPLDIDRKGVNPMRDVRSIFSIYRRIKAVKADICLFFTIKPVVYGGIAATLRFTPFISNVTGLGAAFIGPGWLRIVAKALYRVGLAKAARVFFQNPDDMRLFLSERLTNASRIVLLPGSGVDLLHFSRVAYPSNPNPAFLLIARLLWDKGVGDYVEAARKCRKRHPLVRFQLLGPLGVENRSAIRRIEVETWLREGVVEYLGETDDVRPFIAAADCVVLPSYREGTPRTLLEAAAMGRPVIATDVPGCREVVEDKVNGYLCRVKDSTDLTEKIEWFLALTPQARAQMGSKGREKMEREFDEQIVITRYLTAIDEIAKG